MSMETVQPVAGDGQAPAVPSAAMGAPSASQRLLSLDVLRGFDMFWISGGDGLLAALAKLTGWAWLAWLGTQLTHVAWEGFRFYDLIFPLFLFISGVTLPMAIRRRMERGESRRVIFLRLLRRALVLVVLGILVNTGRISFDLEKVRVASVLGRIGLAGFGAGLIVMFARPRAQAAWAAGILVFYWALLTFVPVPGVGAPNTERGTNLADAIDQRFLPGKTYMPNHDPEGLLSTIPAVATALLGALAGAWLTSPRSTWRKALGLFAAGIMLLALGGLWGMQFPVIKRIWTSSFVLVAGGWSCVLLALFYAVIDGLRWRRWGFLFLLIGMNPITLYVLRATRLIDFRHLGTFFFGFATEGASPALAPLLQILAVLAVQFVFLYILYRRKIFLRV